MNTTLIFIIIWLAIIVIIQTVRLHRCEDLLESKTKLCEKQKELIEKYEVLLPSEVTEIN